MSDEQTDAAPADASAGLASALIILTTVMLLVATITTLKVLGDRYKEGLLKSTSSQRASARVNLQQQLTSRLIGTVTATDITTNDQVQAFGEQNDYGIMGSRLFAPRNVD